MPNIWTDCAGGELKQIQLLLRDASVGKEDQRTSVPS
jgi:hypothetical protein